MSEANRNLAVRVATALVLFPVAVWLTWHGGLPFALLCGAAAAVAASELVLMFAPRLGPAEAFGIAVAGLLPVGVWASWHLGGDLPAEWMGIAGAGAVVVLLALHLFGDGPLEAVPRSAAAVALSWLYCGLLVATVVGLRLRFGFGWVILSFVVSWLNDTLAYFGGRAMGRHPLYPRISPKKTWEGFAAGALGSILGALAVKPLFLPSVPAWALLAIGAGAAVLGPVGDLAESMLKRAAGVKDSGRIIPGHGGLLDRIDALLFVAPWVYVFAALVRG